MTVIEAGIELIKMLIPPKTNDLDAQQRWRWIVFIGIAGLFLGLSAHIALACGWVPSIYSGFALSQDTKAIQQRVDVIATLALEREIRSRTLELCHEKDQERRNELNGDISKLQHEYHDIAQQWYAVPECDKL
jgi:hypothetical protein